MARMDAEDARASTAMPRGMVSRIVVPIGGSDSEYLVQQQAVEYAVALEAPVTGLHVSTAPDRMEGNVFRYLEEQCEKWGVRCDTHVLVDDDVEGAINRDLDASDLVFIGTANLGARYHVSSVAESLVHRAPCPVLVMRIQD